MAVRLSLAIITNNHAATIGRALDSAAPFCDEMIVVDQGSTDGTRRFAEEHGAIVHAASVSDDDGVARNESFGYCTGDWILWLSGDDFVPPAAVPAFFAFAQSMADELTDVDVVVAPYRWSVRDDGTAMTFHRERVLRRAAGLVWEGAFNERIRYDDERFALTEDLVVAHNPDPARLAHAMPEAIERLERLMAEGDRSPRTLFAYSNFVYDQGRYGDAIAGYREYLESDPDGADRYWALVYLAESLIVVEEEDDAARCATEAILEDSSRAEAYMVLGRIRFAEDAWSEALPLFMAASAAARPRIGLFRDGDYTFAPWDFMAVCHEKLGDPRAGIRAALKGLNGNPQADRVKVNLRFMVDQLG